MGNEGFTLLEMLISVFIISIIFYMFIFDIANEVKEGRIRSTSFEIEAVIEGTRSCGIANQTSSVVTLLTSDIVIDCGEESYDVQLEDVNITSNFPNNKIEFSEKGIVKRGGTINVCSKEVCEKITIGIGKSKVNVG